MKNLFAAADAQSSAAISRIHGERILLLPWRPARKFVPGAPDETRAQAEFVSVLSGAIGQQNMKGEATGYDFVATATIRDRKLSTDVRDWPAQARDGDRVQALDLPGQPIYEITSILPEIASRIWAHLIEVRE